MCRLLILSAILQLPALFLGFELCDSGFYMTFYEYFFSAPGVVEYNFMYWLSGLVGGGISAITGHSMFALRLFGLFCNLVSVWLTAALLDRHQWRTPLAVGVALASVAMWLLPLTFYNDTLTAMIALASLLALSRGLSGRKGWLLLLAGTLAGINTFSRIPNVTEILFVLLIPIYAVLSGCKNSWRWSGLFLCGWAVGLSLGAFLIWSAGHLDLFLSNMRDLRSIAATDGTEASHGIGNLIMAQLRVYGRLAPVSLKFVLAYAFWLFLIHIRAGKSVRRLAGAVLLCCVAWTLARIDTVTALEALSLPLLVMNVVFGSRELKFVSWCGLAYTLVLPLGSDWGVYNMGPYAMWLSVPAALCAFTIRPKINGREYDKLPKLSLLVVLLAILGQALWNLGRHGVYFDDSRGAEMVASVSSPRAAGIFTGHKRAEAVDSMLATIGNVTCPGDTLMVYGSAPALNWLTGTKPAIGNSWPELLSAKMLKMKLHECEAPQYVAVMKFGTIGSEWGQPSEAFAQGQAGVNIFHTSEKSAIIHGYLQEKSYTKIADTQRITVYRRD